MSYIQELRLLVGHRPLILAGSLGMNLDAHHQILLQHRTDDKMWDFPGGFMEPGETSEETAQREVREETWLEIGEMRLYMLQSWLHCATRSYHPIPSSNNDYLITSTE